MPTSLVNSLTLLGATLAVVACSNARADSETSAPEHTSVSTVVPASSVPTIPDAGTGSMTAQNDSITRAADLGRVQGNASAALWVVEISDMQCPFCAEWHETTYPQVYEEYIKTGKIRYAYFNYPIKDHRNSMPAHRAGMCASVQNKFWAMQDAIFKNQKKWESLVDPNPFLEGLAKDVGLNVPSWKSCLSSKSIQSVIDADYARAKKQGVRSTPSFMIGGRLVSGVVPMDDLRKIIDAALSEKK